MEFRRQLIATLRCIQPVLAEPGVLVIGSEVPNLLEQGAATTLVVSKDVDIGVPVAAHAGVKARLGAVEGLSPSPTEPSVWVPESEGLIEVNFVGMDPAILDPEESYVLEDEELPLMVFGPLAHMRPGQPIVTEGLSIPVPRPAGLIVEKLITDRAGEKGERDLLVIVGLLLTSGEPDLQEVDEIVRTLSAELRHVVRSNLTILSLLAPREGMPDPEQHRAKVVALLRRLEAGEVIP